MPGGVAKATHLHREEGSLDTLNLADMGRRGPAPLRGEIQEGGLKPPLHRRASAPQALLYRLLRCTYTFCVRNFLKTWRLFVFLCFAFAVVSCVAAQEPAKPGEKQAEQKAEAKSAGVEKKSEKAELPFQIQLLETRVRFEANGDSRKEVHTIVKINNILGAREFARLAFDYNRGWQQVEIPLVRVSHANGGTSELLPSAVTDAPNPAVEKFPAFADLRVKVARVLGLREGDTVEYRVITTTSKHPLAPEYWLEHTFDRSGQVLEEEYEVDMPGNVTSTSSVRAVGAQNGPAPKVFAGVPTTSFERTGLVDDTRSIFRWKIPAERALPRTGEDEGLLAPDVIVTSLRSWDDLARKIGDVYPKWTEADNKEAQRRLPATKTPLLTTKERLRASYELVSQKLATVDLPIGSMGFRIRGVNEIFDSGYASPNEKCYLLWRLAEPAENNAQIVFYGGARASEEYPRPSLLQQVFVLVKGEKKSIALDPSSEVAPFGMIPAQFRGKPVLSISPNDAGDYVFYWVELPEDLPFPARQKVNVVAELGVDGALKSKVSYELRGDNELLLREAFHGTAKEKWKDVANLLAISDGFRGEISSVNVSDPLATREPFRVEYTITQAKFVDWSKKPVRIPALLPQIGLPDLPRKAAEAEAAPKIELGTPLDVETQMTLKLPAGTKAVVPAGTAVSRDYARFASKYGVVGETVTASRRVNFLMREIDGARGMDYNAFVRAVQNDQAGLIVLEREAEEKAEEKKKKE
jgi:hypothetical protein